MLLATLPYIRIGGCKVKFSDNSIFLTQLLYPARVKTTCQMIPITPVITTELIRTESAISLAASFSTNSFPHFLHTHQVRLVDVMVCFLNPHNNPRGPKRMVPQHPLKRPYPPPELFTVVLTIGAQSVRGVPQLGHPMGGSPKPSSG